MHRTITLFLLLAAVVFGQLSDRATWAAQAENNYQMTPDLTYLVASGHEAKVDVYHRRNPNGPAADADSHPRREAG